MLPCADFHMSRVGHSHHFDVPRNRARDQTKILPTLKQNQVQTTLSLQIVFRTTSSYHVYTVCLKKN